MKVRIVCDGAVSGNGKAQSWGGYAAILSDQAGHELVVTGSELQTTNNRMELMACIKALDRIVKTPLTLEIVSDSQYLISTFKEGWIKSWIENGLEGRINGDLWQTLYKQVLRLQHAGCSFIWTHIRGHVKTNRTALHDVQDRCDVLAKAEVKKLKDLDESPLPF
jgi:ribonuclease HI